MLRRIAVNYLARHRNWPNRILHLVGVPLTFLGAPIFAVQSAWLWAFAAFIVGYAVQFIGHGIEGNDAGEVVLIKRWLDLPYAEFAPIGEVSKSSE